MVLAGESEPLSGSIPLEEMDVLIHPYPRRRVVNSRAAILCPNEVEVTAKDRKMSITLLYVRFM